MYHFDPPRSTYMSLCMCIQYAHENTKITLHTHTFVNNAYT